MVVLRNIRSAGVIVIAITLVLLFAWLHADNASGIHRDDTAPTEENKQDSGSKEPAGKEKGKIKYWVAPMDPTYIRNKPGKSPMGMDLVPVYEDGEGGADDGSVRIDPVTVQSMGVRTTKVTRGPLKSSIRTIGHITYDEERVKHIHTKVSGWVEQLFVKTTGEKILKDQEILSIYSPELVATEQEYLQALSYKDKVANSSFPDVVTGAASLLESTKKRLMLMDISSEQIQSIEESGQIHKEMILRSPTSGIVIEKRVFEGMQVSPGMELYTIADLSRVWAIASVYEYELPFISIGQDTVMTLPYDPGTQYQGKVTFIYPYLSPKTRTVQVRMEFANPDLKLKPNMYADVVITTSMSKNVLLVPTEAILRTGYRDVVIASLGDGKFLPKKVTVGAEGEEVTQILNGLEEGETIVTSGQFLIDSESNLKEAIHKMLEGQTLESSDDKEVPSIKNHSQMSKTPVSISDDQKKIMSTMIENYLGIHIALVAESVSDIVLQTRALSTSLNKMKKTNPEGTLKDMMVSLEASLQGLLSKDLKKARDAFKILSSTMADYVKSEGRDDAVLSGIKVYFCPMEEERWLQKGTDLKNPYLGKDMWICGTEEKL
jgi:RND family efflux transporter MFP subunit